MEGRIYQTIMLIYLIKFIFSRIFGKKNMYYNHKRK
jgi:hypothetical protein